MKRGHVTRMKGYSLIIACNVITLSFFLLLLSYSINVEAMRPLKHQSDSSPSFLSLIINRAYSGPSHRGRGH
ncbi:hypothetical protein RJT34_25367 [Clitoria ternatea]|uniref:Uncharacterized protein n=1 Tax=Clitoria ternatea TaxID=43366 RepID=A0AAN9FVY5_CLITE